jgi:hypothetical protein
MRAAGTLWNTRIIMQVYVTTVSTHQLVVPRGLIKGTA